MLFQINSPKKLMNVIYCNLIGGVQILDARIRL